MIVGSGWKRALLAAMRLIGTGQRGRIIRKPLTQASQYTACGAIPFVTLFDRNSGSYHSIVPWWDVVNLRPCMVSPRAKPEVSGFHVDVT